MKSKQRHIPSLPTLLWLFLAISPLFTLAAEDSPAFELKKNPLGQWTIIAINLKPELKGKFLKNDHEPGTWVISRLPGSEEADKTPVPVAGDWQDDNGSLCFRPKYPFRAGLQFRVSELLPAGRQKVIGSFEIPSDGGPAPEVVSLQPGLKNWPENILRAYLHFNRPMARGEAIKRISIRDETGRVLVQPFLELDQELWDRDGTRLTLLFDPGRVKSGLKPREEDGAILEKGHSYTINIAAGWPDSRGVATMKAFEHKVSVSPADHEPVEPRRWKILPPKSSTTDPVVIQFDAPVDTGMAVRLIGVLESGECPLDGSATISNDGMTFQFKPQVKWSPGLHFIEINPALEDPSGNQVGRPFERDMKAEGETLMKTARPVRLTFVVESNE